MLKGPAFGQAVGRHRIFRRTLVTCLDQIEYGSTTTHALLRLDMTLEQDAQMKNHTSSKPLVTSICMILLAQLVLMLSCASPAGSILLFALTGTIITAFIASQQPNGTPCTPHMPGICLTHACIMVNCSTTFTLNQSRLHRCSGKCDHCLPGP